MRFTSQLFSIEKLQLNFEELVAVLKTFKMEKAEKVLEIEKLNLEMPEVGQLALELQKFETYEKDANNLQGNSRRRNPMTGEVGLGRQNMQAWLSENRSPINFY